MEKIKQHPLPRTNPVNLIFVLSQFAPKVTTIHFPASRDFYDLIMRTSLSSQSRADAFLWLMWHYLESDFTEEGSAENPFGEGVEYDPQLRNQGVPRFVHLSPEEEEEENIDTPEETEYGQTKMKERKRIIEADQAAFQAEVGPPKRGPKPKLNLPPDDSPAGYLGRMKPDAGASPAAMLGRMRPKYESDMDSTRSTPPPRAGPANMRIQNVLNTGSKGRGSLKNQMIEGSSPIAEPGTGPSMRRPRPLTAHQQAVERNRNQRVEYILSRGIRKAHHQSRKIRKQEGAFIRAANRIKNCVDPYEDSEGDESQMKNPYPFKERGVVGLVQLEGEEEDYGEEMSAYAASFRRAERRLKRWDSQKGLDLGVMGTTRVVHQTNGHGDIDETEDDNPRNGGRHFNGNGMRDVHMGEDFEQLDDMEKEILGMGSGDEDEGEDLNDLDKELLGLGGDETDFESDRDIELL